MSIEIVLLDEISKLGNLGDKVNVKAGFARNYLFPKQLALPATKENLAYFESKRKELEAKLKEKLKGANALKAKVDDLISIEIFKKAGEGGKLFGSVTTQDIVKKIKENEIIINKSHIHMPSESIRLLGEYEINFTFEKDIKSKINLKVSEDKD